MLNEQQTKELNDKAIAAIADHIKNNFEGVTPEGDNAFRVGGILVEICEPGAREVYWKAKIHSEQLGVKEIPMVSRYCRKRASGEEQFWVHLKLAQTALRVSPT